MTLTWQMPASCVVFVSAFLSRRRSHPCLGGRGHLGSLRQRLHRKKSNLHGDGLSLCAAWRVGPTVGPAPAQLGAWWVTPWPTLPLSQLTRGDLRRLRAGFALSPLWPRRPAVGAELGVEAAPQVAEGGPPTAGAAEWPKQCRWRRCPGPAVSASMPPQRPPAPDGGLPAAPAAAAMGRGCGGSFLAAGRRILALRQGSPPAHMRSRRRSCRAPGAGDGPARFDVCPHMARLPALARQRASGSWGNKLTGSRFGDEALTSVLLCGVHRSCRLVQHGTASPSFGSLGPTGWRPLGPGECQFGTASWLGSAPCAKRLRGTSAGGDPRITVIRPMMRARPLIAGRNVTPALRTGAWTTTKQRIKEPTCKEPLSSTNEQAHLQRTLLPQAAQQGRRQGRNRASLAAVLGPPSSP